MFDRRMRFFIVRFRIWSGEKIVIVWHGRLRVAARIVNGGLRGLCGPRCDRVKTMCESTTLRSRSSRADSVRIFSNRKVRGRIPRCQTNCSDGLAISCMAGSRGTSCRGYCRCPCWSRCATQLRRENLHDTEEPPLEQKPVPPNLDPAVRNERTIDGSNNDLKFPAMGSCGRRFGRNVPLEHTFPDTANLMTPSPSVVSRELMTREEFQPATILNLLAAAWIQFMVHDWFVHKRSPIEDGVEIPLAPGDDWADGRMKIPRSVPEPGAGRVDTAARIRESEQPLVGWIADLRLRSGRWRRRCAPGKAASSGSKRRSCCRSTRETGVHLSGFTDNWWIGLAMLHTIFTQEHNHICDLLAKEHPDWNDAAAPRKGQADQLRRDGQDSHRRSGRRRSFRTRSSNMR